MKSYIRVTIKLLSTAYMKWIFLKTPEKLDSIPIISVEQQILHRFTQAVFRMILNADCSMQSSESSGVNTVVSE